MVFLGNVVVSLMLMLLNIAWYAKLVANTDLEGNKMAIGFSVFVGFVICSIGGFFIYHLYLICKNRTTREHKKEIDVD